VTFSVITTTTGISINKRYFVKNPPITCTFQDTGDTVTAVAHGFVNDERVRFYNITTTTGITKAITKIPTTIIAEKIMAVALLLFFHSE
jgi:hypothetical protein